MISRVAENCFWVHRYLERVDTMARVLRVNSAFVLDVDLPDAEAWHPILIVAGEEPRYLELFDEDATEDGEAVQEFLTWDERSPVSILSSLYWARENARRIRETISLEMWEVVNELWLWLRGDQGRRLYNRERLSFYDRVKQACQLFYGVTHDTMIHGEAFDFMRLGLSLERAGQTARILDVKYHALGPGRRGRETAAETAEWVAILRSCSAYEPFFKRGVAPLEGRTVAEFLMLDPLFPRSILHGLERAMNFLRRIRPDESGEIGVVTAERLGRLRDDFHGHSIDRVLEVGIHDELTRTVEAIAGICEAVENDFFAAAVPAAAREPTRKTRRGSPREQVAGETTAEGPSQSQGITMGRGGTQSKMSDGTPWGDGRTRAVETRTLAVVHVTTYRYDSIVDRGLHNFRLRPADDRVQEVLEHDLSLSVAAELLEHEDVFGNHVYHAEIAEPFRELRIESRSIVRLLSNSGQHAHNPPRPLDLPLVWMPWQHQMMLPYLLPPELPEAELKELSDYASSFRNRNEQDLYRTLVDMNSTLHREWQYVPGETHVETTPYEVFRSRRGVCQDFANLFICLARLQGVPARYRVGYIYTGADYQNPLQSEASHAWVELFLPWLGWRGFDPTNGARVEMSHIRVAVGRNYLDATPTSGIVSPAGVGETLEVHVEVELLEPSAPDA